MPRGRRAAAFPVQGCTASLLQLGKPGTSPGPPGSRHPAGSPASSRMGKLRPRSQRSLHGTAQPPEAARASQGIHLVERGPEASQASRTGKPRSSWRPGSFFPHGCYRGRAAWRVTLLALARRKLRLRSQPILPMVCASRCCPDLQLLSVFTQLSVLSLLLSVSDLLGNDGTECRAGLSLPVGGWRWGASLGRVSVVSCSLFPLGCMWGPSGGLAPKVL